MIYFALRDDILVYQRKRGAANIVGTAQGLAQRFNEGGFAGAHLSAKQKNFLPGGSQYNLLCRGINIFELVFYRDVAHFECKYRNGTANYSTKRGMIYGNKLSIIFESLKSVFTFGYGIS